MIDVIEPGFATTVQDEGRPGFYKSGIGPSGAMDMLSYRLGNGIVGNVSGSASLELTFTGPRLHFRRALTFAVTGGEIPVYLNGHDVPAWTRVAAKPDDILHFGYLKSGVRAYLAIEGGIDVPMVMDSRSTHVLVQIGGHRGRKLEAGDTLNVATGGGRAPSSDTLDPRFIPRFQRDVEIRFVPGLFDYRLTDDGKRQFAAREWSVTPNADRTGIRMTSTSPDSLEFVSREPPFGAGSDPSNVADAGYPIGAIQIPSGTEPIVLSRDAVTAGGYFTVGAVITADLDSLGQVPTRGTVRFAPVPVETAVAIRRERAKLTAEALDSLH